MNQRRLPRPASGSGERRMQAVQVGGEVGIFLDRSNHSQALLLWRRSLRLLTGKVLWTDLWSLAPPADPRNPKLHSS